MTDLDLLELTVLRPGDAGYTDACLATIWNADIDRHPAAIVPTDTAADVAAVVRGARAADMDLTVRGGGHSFAGHAVADGAVMIDLGGLDEIVVDPAAKRVRCGGGTTWAQLDAATAAYGMAVPGGTISHTGVGGLALGGGFGWLTQRAGLTCDNLVSAEVVTADGRIVTASASENPDLFWALRGGGGNFGIVTTFEFAMHELGPMANLGLFFFEATRAAEALRFARTYLHELPDTYGSMIAGLSAPPAPFVPEEHVGTPGYAILIANWDSAEDHAVTVDPIRAYRPMFEFVSPIPHTGLQQFIDAAAPWGAYAYEKALYLDDLPDPVIDASVAALPNRASPMSITPIFASGGEFARVPEDATAFGGRRTMRWIYNISAVGPTPGLLAADRPWVSGLYDAIAPYATAGTYVNFLNDKDVERVRQSYGPAKYDRLAAIKAVWDPDNVFRHNANIAPAG
jgi:hypothetical protein